MIDSPSPTYSPPRRFRYSLKHLMLPVVFVAIAITVVQMYRLKSSHRQLVQESRQLALENKELEFKLLLQSLAGEMKIPTDALHHRYLPIVELHRIRVDSLRAAGVEKFVPIFYLQRHNIESPQTLNSNAFRIRDGSISLENFWEGYAKTRAGNGPSALSAYLRGTPAFREWLLSEPDLIREFVRPLLFRIAEAPDPRARYDAIEAMLLLDDRSYVILDILRDSIQHPEEAPDGLTELERLRFYDVEPVRAQKLIDEFGLQDAIKQLDKSTTQ